MSFETMGGYEAEDNSLPEQGHIEIPERIGGPLKPNHLVTSKMGIEEAMPILDRLKVQRKISLYMAEVRLNEDAVAPAEYRLEIMDPNDSEKPASEEYVREVFDALQEARVPVQKAARGEDDETESKAN